MFLSCFTTILISAAEAHLVPPLSLGEGNRSRLDILLDNSTTQLNLLLLVHQPNARHRDTEVVQNQTRLILYKARVSTMLK